MKKTVFAEEKNDMVFFINSHGKLYINFGIPDEEYYNGYICLDKEDVSLLIKDLKKLLSEM